MWGEKTHSIIGVKIVVCVSEVEFATLSLAHRNMCFEKRKDERVKDEESLIPGLLCGHQWYDTAAVFC